MHRPDIRRAMSSSCFDVAFLLAIRIADAAQAGERKPAGDAIAGGFSNGFGDRFLEWD